MAATRNNEKNLQYHFIVSWDAATRTWSVDVDTLDAKFDGEVVWDEDKQVWANIRFDDDLREAFVEREDALAAILAEYNEALHEDDDLTD